MTNRLRVAMTMTPAGPVLRSRSYLADIERHGIKPGDHVNAHITKPRNGKHHRKGMAWLADLFDNQADFDDRERMRQWIIVEAGHFKAWPVKREWITPAKALEFMQWFIDLGKDEELGGRWPFLVEISDGTIEVRKALRTNFERMDQPQFTSLYERMCKAVFDRWGFDVSAWEKIGKEAA